MPRRDPFTDSRAAPMIAGLALLFACKQGEPTPTGDEQAAKASSATPIETTPDEAAGASEAARSEAEGPAPELGDEPQTSDQPAGEGSPSSVPARAAEPGPVYFVINSGGIARLDERGVTSVLDELERHVSRLFIGPDAGVYVLDARSLRKIEGDDVVEVERFSFDDVAPVDDLALSEAGEPWVIGSKGVGTRVAGSWEMTPLSELGLDFHAKLAIAGNGTVWVVGSKAALYREQDRWVPIDAPELRTAALLQRPRVSPLGSVLATDGKRLLRLGKRGIDSIPLGGGELVSYGAGFDVAADGQVGLATGSCELLRIDPASSGRASQAWRFAGEEHGCNSVEAIALDARHRFWVASREGLSVVGEDRRLREYPAGSFPELAGRVSHMLVVGQGPELPPNPELHTATIVGQVRVGDDPGAKLAVELCPTVRPFTEGSPCAAAEPRHSGTTDAEGRFRFEEVPLGDYSVAVQVDGRWRWSTPPTFGARMRTGEEFDLGTVMLPKM